MSKDLLVQLASPNAAIICMLSRWTALPSFGGTHRTPKSRFDPGRTAEPLPAAGQAAKACHSLQKLRSVRPN
eukprot:Skav225263  [mRNA]  locus=scaffold4099:67444:68348:- [translate_table: standard]